MSLIPTLPLVIRAIAWIPERSSCVSRGFFLPSFPGREKDMNAATRFEILNWMGGDEGLTHPPFLFTT